MELSEVKAVSAFSPEGLLFPGHSGQSASHNALRDRMRRAWRVIGLAPLGLHEARHTYASLMIAAGVNAKALSTYMGHANIAITLDRYGHLMPGNEARGANPLRCLPRGRPFVAPQAVPAETSHLQE